MGLFQKISATRFVKSDSGASAVEFAFVAFPFFYVLGCLMETGVMLFTEYVIQTSVQDAARQIRTGSAQAASTTSAGFKNKICATTSIIVSCAKITVYVKPATTFSTLKAATPSPLAISAKPGDTPVFDCGQPSQPLAVIATYDWNFVFPFMSFLGNVNSNTARRISGIAIFRNEPYPPGAATCG